MLEIVCSLAQNLLHRTQLALTFTVSVGRGWLVLIVMKQRSLLRALLLSGVLISLSGSPLRADDIGDLDTRPVPLKTPPPVYPIELRRKGIAGVVAVRVVVDEQGNVVECAVKKSSRLEFDDPALTAVKHWKFKPATKDGVPVRCHFLVPINFNVD